jgi:uncharacterized protein (DUF2252 family)
MALEVTALEQRRDIERLRIFNQNRLPGMVTRKYQAMRAHPFAFFRGSCHLFYEDWPAAPLDAAPPAWLCGDLHLENFGVFKAADRRIYFDINDFDDGALAPCAWDAARWLTSLYLAGDLLDLSEGDVTTLGRFFLARYFSTLAAGHAAPLQPVPTSEAVIRLKREAESRSRQKFLEARTRREAGERRFVESKKHLNVTAEEKKRVVRAVNRLGEQSGNAKLYRPLDVAFRVAGTGSLGLKRYVVLVEGRGSPDENFILDLKESHPSALAPALNISQPEWASEAQRAVTVQERAQSMPPALLDTLEIEGEWYILRELQPEQDKFAVTGWETHPGWIQSLCAEMAEITARAHLRSAGREGAASLDSFVAFGEQAALSGELLAFARRAAERVRADYRAFCEASPKGAGGLAG